MTGEGGDGGEGVFHIVIFTSYRIKQDLVTSSMQLYSFNYLFKCFLVLQLSPTGNLNLSTCFFPFSLKKKILALILLSHHQIEDLYGFGNHVKLNDPTVWLTRRLLDPNTRFVVAVCPSSTSSTDNNGPQEDLKQGGAFHFLLDHFLSHLESSSLDQDYTRLHQVKYELAST